MRRVRQVSPTGTAGGVPERASALLGVREGSDDEESGLTVPVQAMREESHHMRIPKLTIEKATLRCPCGADVEWNESDGIYTHDDDGERMHAPQTAEWYLCPACVTKLRIPKALR